MPDWESALSHCPVGGVLNARYCIRLRASLSLDDVEFDLVAFFECFVSARLNR